MRILGLDGQQGGDGRKDGWKDGRTDGWTDRRLKITPCVLQEIGPLGPLPKKSERIHIDGNTRCGILATFEWTNGRTTGKPTKVPTRPIVSLQFQTFDL
ncbi:MAG: hypothetical protein VX367_06500 [SAR324 cluster bacterium]|nr:hypothetical protein [SAR324 cluster bacterium]